MSRKIQKSKLKFKKESSAGAIIFYRDKNGEPLFLLLNYSAKGNYWDFPRGHLEKGEELIDAAKREIMEETGLMDYDMLFRDGFKEIIQWFYFRDGTRRFKSATYFLAETSKIKIKLSEEHMKYKWLPFEDAFKQLKYKNTKQVLTKAKAML